jgi:hypothetical protein
MIKRINWLSIFVILVCAVLEARLLVRGRHLAVTRSPVAERAAFIRGGHGDSTALAGMIRARCSTTFGDPRMECYQQMLETVREGSGVRIAMGTLGRLGELDEQWVKTYGHVYTHVLGIRAYSPGSDLKTVFESCTELYQSGCYHGVIQAYFETVRSDAPEVVRAICKAYTNDDANQWLRFQCVHGAGHGLTMFRNHDLVLALAGCDGFEITVDRESCYGGAFMESLVNATDPHHHPMAMASAADSAPEHEAAHAADSAAAKPQIAHAEMPGMSMAPPTFRALDPNDLQYPCDSLAPRYSDSCYSMQGAVILTHLQFDFARAAQACEAAPQKVIHTCYQSLGTEASGVTTGDERGTIELCLKGSPRYQPWCFVGAAANFIDVTAKPETGISLCRSVPGQNNKSLCYMAVGQEIGVLEPYADGRTTGCEKAEPAFRSSCLWGARVSARPP